MTMLYVVIACGLLSVLYAIWATQSVLAADQGNARMQEIAGALREEAWLVALVAHRDALRVVELLVEARKLAHLRPHAEELCEGLRVGSIEGCAGAGYADAQRPALTDLRERARSGRSAREGEKPHDCHTH